MAKQKGVIKLEGTISDINFYRTAKGGYMAREKTSVSGERILTDPQFIRVRENMSEFSKAAKGGKLFRTAIKELLRDAIDPSVSNRLTAAIMKVLKTDPNEERGLRTVDKGDSSLLLGFELNNAATLPLIFYAPFTTAIDRETGVCNVTLADFNPAEMLLPPQSATQFKVVSLATTVSFLDSTYNTTTAESAMFPWKKSVVPGVSLTTNVPPRSTTPIFLLFGIQFFQVINGQTYLLKEGTANPLAVVAVDDPVR